MRNAVVVAAVALLVAAAKAEIVASGKADKTTPSSSTTMSSEELPVEEVVPDAFDFSLQLQNFTLDENGTVTAGNHTDKHVGFLHGFVESLSVIVVSELGDKTFFIAAIMAMTSNKLTVFLAAISALVLMTVLSALLGWVATTFIPLVYTYYTCTAIMFLFGLKMLWDAYRMKPDEMAGIQAEVEEELQRRGSVASNASNNHNGSNGNAANSGRDVEMQAEQQEPLNQEHADENGTEDATPAPIAQAESSEDNAVAAETTTEAADAVGAEDNTSAKRENKISNMAKKRVNFSEKSLFGKKCHKIFKVFVNCFTMTFLAEWGDRSQLATIVLAGVNDVGGVCLGASLGHVILTGSAVICGAIVAKKISVRVITFFGGFVFIGFAIYSLCTPPEEE